MTKRQQEACAEPFISHYQVERPVNWSEQFGPSDSPKPLDVEIGSGLGDFLVPLACRHSDRNFVGIEQDRQRVKKILKKINRAPDASRNVRVLQIDAAVALERLFNPLTIARVYCLFPCPWPKKKHIKHRLFSHDFLKLLNSRLVSKGEVQVVTDYLPYFKWIEEQAPGTGFKKAARIIQPQFDTKFERKWRQEGQEEFFELNLVKEKHVAVPLEKDVPLKCYSVENFVPELFRLPDVVGDVSVIFKDFLSDPRRCKAMVRVVAAERSMTQHFWIKIAQDSSSQCRWHIAVAEGQKIIPTRGVARALQHVYKTIKGKDEIP